MKFIFKLLVVIGLITTSSKLVAQDQIMKTHSYSFKNAENKEVINKIQQELERLDFVTQVKIKYAEPKKSGLLIITTSEKPVKNENDKVFSPTALKSVLLKNNITPIEYRLIENPQH